MLIICGGKWHEILNTSMSPSSVEAIRSSSAALTAGLPSFLSGFSPASLEIADKSIRAAWHSAKSI